MFGRKSMKKVNCFLSLALCLGLAVPSWAQPGGSLTDGNAVYSQTGAPTSAGSTGPSGNFQPEGTTDHLFQMWWWYRVSGDSRERPFGSYTDGTRVISGTSNYSGNTATYDWTVTEGGTDLFLARWTKVLNDGLNPGEAYLSQSFQITNLTASTLDLSLFMYVDYDLNDTDANDSATLVAPGLIQVTDGGSIFAEMLGVGASAYQVGTWPSIRNLLTNATVDNFNNTGLPYGPGDFSGGFQWNLSIPAGQSLAINASLAAIPEPHVMVLAGMGMIGASFAYKRRRDRR